MIESGRIRDFVMLDVTVHANVSNAEANARDHLENEGIDGTIRRNV